MNHSSVPFPAARTAAIALALATIAPAQFKVALCGAASTSSTACQWIDVQTRLMATGFFSAVDIINVTTTGGGTPSLNTLLQYDSLLCYTNSTPANNNTWGDVLADYVDAGGGVVVAVFANSTTSVGRNIGGRWQLGYEVIMDQSGNASGAGATLGTVHVPGHPVLAGVTSFAGGTTGSRPTGTALEVGAFVVAEWSDGKILVAQGANPRRVDLGFYPPNASCSQSGWSTGGDLLMANALVATANGATFGPYGAGCAGSIGVPQMTAQPGSRPMFGTTMTVDITNAPFGIAVVGFGFSNTMSGALPLPFDLTILGMTGCSLLADPLVTDVAVGVPTTASYGLVIPLDTSLFGTVLYEQAFPLDVAANPFGFTASNAARLKLGF
jgi:hypothetical protein